MLRRIFAVIMGLAVLQLLLMLLVPENPALQQRFLILDSVTLVILAGLTLLLNRGYLEAAAIIFIILIFSLVLFLSLYVVQNAFNPAFSAYFWLIPLSGLLLGRRTMIVTTVAVLIALSTGFALQVNGLIMPVPELVGQNTLLVVAAAVILSYATYNAHLNLLLRKGELAESQARSLAESSALLEQRVIERTDDLAKVNRALTVSEARYRTLVENAYEAIVLLDYASWRLMDANSKAEALFGFSRTELLTKTTFDLSPPTQPLDVTILEDPSLSENLARGLEVVFEWNHQDAKGRVFPCEVRLVHLPGTDPMMLRGSIVDISQRKREEDLLRQAQKLESLGILAGGIAHDFNNLLVAIMGQNSLAQLKLEESHPAYRHIDKAVKAAESAAGLTRQLLAYSGRASVEERALDINDLIENNLRLLEAVVPRTIRLETNLKDDLPAVWADSAQMQQVLMNLIINAVQAMQDGRGVITVATEEIDLQNPLMFEQHTGQTVSPGRYAVIRIADTGCGMTLEQIQRVFDPFFTTKETGTGLGLSTVLGIVRSHKGGIRIESTPDVGTVFELLFPIIADRYEPESVAEPVSLPGDKRDTVLIIDDDRVVAEAAADILKSGGWETHVADSGLQGLAYFRQHTASVALVLLDLRMPGMDGEQTYAHLKEIDPGVRVLLNSGFDATDARRRLYDAGVREYLPKPYTAEQLTHKVRSIVVPLSDQ